MSDGGAKAADPVAQAAMRLEAAVERLAEALAAAAAARRAAGETGALPEDAIPRAEVAALAERLDATIARLRGALADDLRRAGEEE